MIRPFAGLLIVAAIFLAGPSASAEILQQNQVPLELRILDPECTIDSVDAGTGIITAYTCPEPPEPPRPVDPDPIAPTQPQVPDDNFGWLPGVPNTGIFQAITKDPLSSSIWLAFLISLVSVFIIYRRRRKKPTSQASKTAKSRRSKPRRK